MPRGRGPVDLDALYATSPPWDIGRPQPALAALAESGAITGRVLDVEYGTGEHTLMAAMAAALGLEAVGIDLSATALQTAERKARERGLAARFLRHDALRLPELGESFDTALDSLVLHALPAADRTAYLDGLHTVLRPGGRLFVLCYSDRQPPHVTVPHTMSRQQLESCFTSGWAPESIQPTESRSTIYPGVPAWLAAAVRTGHPKTRRRPRRCTPPARPSRPTAPAAISPNWAGTRGR